MKTASQRHKERKRRRKSMAERNKFLRDVRRFVWMFPRLIGTYKDYTEELVTRLNDPERVGVEEIKW